MEACPTAATEDQRRPGLDRADYFLKTEGTSQFPEIENRKVLFSNL